MDRSKLKSYAPEARQEFIQAVTDRSAYYGLTKNKTEPITEQGETVVIQGGAFPKIVATQRKKLEERISGESFDQVMEAVAYTWFNRFVAIRYMELHGYLDHGYRILSHPEGESTPEILEHAQHLDLPGLDKEKVVELKLDGTRDEELYRLLLVAQCNALNKAMPFLFERVQDESELLLPDNLLHSNSLIRKLVSEIEEENWQEVEIIGWVYQFYISDKKAEVIGKVVKSEDIPAATQLFTPNWIVKYLVQNSIGRQWMATYPNSPLKGLMEYYIEPAEQTDEVNAKLAEITPASLNPEEMTLLDPACGSGHILVEGYEIFKAIYQERGYRAKDIPRLILEKNLHGLEIDDRAAQLASFAVLMKARSDDRRILEDGVKIRILSIQSSDGLDADAIFEALSGQEPEPLPPGEEFDFVEEAKTPLLTQARRLRATATADVGFTVDDIRVLLSLLKGTDAKTFGSLIRIPDGLAQKLPEIADRTDRLVHGNNLNRQRIVELFQPITEQTAILSRRYDAVVANPPYMGVRYQTPDLKRLVATHYSGTGGDLFTCFIRRLREFTSAEPAGRTGCVAPYNWMFLGDYESLRDEVLRTTTTASVVKLEYNAFEPAAVPVAAWCSLPIAIAPHKGAFIELAEFKGADAQAPRTLEAINKRLECSWYYEVPQSSFENIPGKPLAFWLSPDVTAAFRAPARLGQFIDITGSQTVTAKNAQFLRLWFEVSWQDIGADNGGKWNIYAKGGKFRRWYGNLEWVVDWSDSAREFFRTNPSSSMLAEEYWYREGLTYTDITTLGFTARYLPAGCLYDKAGPSLHAEDPIAVLAFLNSSPVAAMLGALNPTMHCQVKDVCALPGDPIHGLPSAIAQGARRLIEIYRREWDFHETSIEFCRNGEGFLFAGRSTGIQTLKSIVDAALDEFSRLGDEAITLQLRNDEYFLQRLSIRDLKRPAKDGPLVTFRVPWCDDASVTDHASVRRSFSQFATRGTISYAIGCMMGRYNLDEPGLAYAQIANQGFDPNQYTTYPADDDGIVPITDYEWFGDDATNRFVEFLSAAWPREHLEENLSFVAENLSPKRGEQPKNTVRRFLANAFYKHHLQTYSKRPIYWLYCSGKERAFQALVYLHRYNEGTLARMRTEYVIPLQGKMSARIDHLDVEVVSATSTSHRNKIEKEQSKLKKQLEELQGFDERLRHYADQRISLDLDDGVKVNYGKFGDLLAEVKTVTGKA